MKNRIIIHFYNVGEKVDTARRCGGRETLTQIEDIPVDDNHDHRVQYWTFDPPKGILHILCPMSVHLTLYEGVSFRSRYFFRWGVIPWLS